MDPDSANLVIVILHFVLAAFCFTGALGWVRMPQKPALAGGMSLTILGVIQLLRVI